MELIIREVSKTYPNGVQALKDVTLTIPAGMYGLLGPNGAGKSTLMRILATLQEADEGSVRLADPSSGQAIDVLNQKDEVRKTLGYLPQEFGVYPKVSAEDLLDHFALLKGIAERRARREVVDALLRQTNLWDVRKQKLGGYSGGMRQRFGVAVALLGNPKLMIVDEPTAGLDPAERVRFLNLLAELGENSVVLLSTHIVEDVSELCTRMAIIDRGEILLEAEPLRAVDELRGRIWRRVIAKEDAAGVGARARGDLDEAPRRAHRRARLQQHGARTWLRGRRAGPRRRLLQHDDGAHRPASRAAGAGGDAMRLLEISRFELAYQARRLPTWVYFVTLFVVGFAVDADRHTCRRRSFSIRRPSSRSSLLWGARSGFCWPGPIAGDAAARDVETRMHPLTYTAPVSKADYLGGRFLAAFVLNASMLLALQAGILLSLVLPHPQPELIGPFRPAGLLTPYFFIALPNAFVATAIQFSAAVRQRRAIAGYLGKCAADRHLPVRGRDDEPASRELESGKSDRLRRLRQHPGVKWRHGHRLKRNTRLIALEGALLANRVLWLGVALGAITFTVPPLSVRRPCDAQPLDSLSLSRLRASYGQAGLRAVGARGESDRGEHPDRRSPRSADVWLRDRRTSNGSPSRGHRS